MAFLNLRKNKKEGPTPAKKLVPVAVPSRPVSDKTTGNPDVLRRPHITEKAAGGNVRGVYVFEVSKNSTKREIARAVSAMYKVSPVKITTVTIPKKRITVKGRPGVRSGGKKAYVYLKAGDRIENI